MVSGNFGPLITICAKETASSKFLMAHTLRGKTSFFLNGIIKYKKLEFDRSLDGIVVKVGDIFKRR